MAKYDKETKFYWLQLKEDFFEEDAIEWLEEQEDGHKYSLFYLKLCLKSLKSNGVLIRKVGNMLVPYDNKKLAKLTNVDINTVIVAMELLKGIGLVKVLEGGELYLTQLENMVGSASKGALKKQQQRALKKEEQLKLGKGEEENEEGGQMSTPESTEVSTKDRDKVKNRNKDIVIDIEIEEEKKKEVNKYFDNQDINNIFIEFLGIRKKLKAVNSDRAIKTLINTLNNYDDATKYKMIENSIVNSWKSVYELKPNASNNYKRVEEVPEWLKKGTKEDMELPKWFGKKAEEEPFSSQEEKEELEAIVRSFDSDFEERKAALQERLRNKYGKGASKTN